MITGVVLQVKILQVNLLVMERCTNTSESYPSDMFEKDSYLIGKDLKFKAKVKSLEDLGTHEQNIISSHSKTVNEKNLDDKKLFAKNSIKKQLQFNLNRELIREKMPTKKKKNTESCGNLHDQLTKLKNEEIKKRRVASSQSIKSNPDDSWLIKLRKKIVVFKSKAYCVLERPSGISGLIYRIFIFTLVFGSILIGALTTIKSFSHLTHRFLFGYELFVTTYFFVEFLIRFWCVDQRLAFKGLKGRLRFMLRPLQLIELTLLIISIVILSTGCAKRTSFIELGPEALSTLKFFQIFRFFFIDRQAQTWIILSKVIKQHRFELLSCIYIGVIILLFSSYLILYFERPFTEKNDNNEFLTYADAIYWSIITMATIGYGK